MLRAKVGSAGKSAKLTILHLAPYSGPFEPRSFNLRPSFLKKPFKILQKRGLQDFLKLPRHLSWSASAKCDATLSPNAPRTKKKL